MGLTLTTQGGDCDLYVRGGTYPTRTDFDYFDASGASTQIELVIPSAALEGQAWYIVRTLLPSI
jgi:hypothetical protein